MNQSGVHPGIKRCNSAIALARRCSAVMIGRGAGFGLARAVRKASRHGSGGLPAARQAFQNARMRFETASDMRRRPSGVCLPLPSAEPCIRHRDRGPSGPTTTRARQKPPALVRAPQDGAHVCLPAIYVPFRQKAHVARACRQREASPFKPEQIMSPRRAYAERRAFAFLGLVRLQLRLHDRPSRRD